MAANYEDSIPQEAEQARLMNRWIFNRDFAELSAS